MSNIDSSINVNSTSSSNRTRTSNRRSDDGIGRRLCGKPEMWIDWDDDEEAEGSVAYWILFTDLLMVAAASSVAESLEENLNAEGILEFISLYMIITCGWLLYCQTYSARFFDGSLCHCGVLFVFLLGMAAQIVNASYERAVGFSYAVLLQRSAFLVMELLVWIFIPRAQAYSLCVIGGTLLGMIPFLITLVQPEYAVPLWAIAALWDYLGDFVTIRLLPRSALVPINIEYSKDRLGVLVLVMLGETVISSTLTYLTYAEELNESGGGTRYYLMAALAFLLIFMFTLAYFNVQPPPKHHAFRRSRFTGLAVLILTKSLGLTLLLVGVAIKLAVVDVAEQHRQSHEQAEDGEQPDDPVGLSGFTSRLLSCAVGCSLVLLLLIRMCHYWGKLPRPHDPPSVRRLMWFWWGFVLLLSILPFFVGAVADPLTAFGLHASLLLVLVLVESWITHTLMEWLPKEEEEEETEPLRSEREGAGDKNYGTVEGETR